MSFKPGDKVAWKWAGGVVIGSIEEVHLKTIVKAIKGARIVRHGSPQRPAYLVKSEAGNFALKLETELFVPNNVGAKSHRKKRPDWDF